MNYLTSLVFCTVLTVLMINCTSEKSENDYLERTALLEAARKTYRTGSSLRAAEEGTALPELDYRVPKETIEEVAKILFNPSSVNQAGMNKATTLLHRMQKEDYEKTYLLYLDKKIEDAKERKLDETNIASRVNRRRYREAIFKYAQPYEMSFGRLPKELQREITLEAKRELFQFHYDNEPSADRRRQMLKLKEKLGI